jgi:Na+/H+ antiporter NhaD/arsenite permease-like protein
MLTGATALTSAFLDNVTTVLLIVPVTLAIAGTIEVDPVPLVVAEVVASNIGGAATLIGDPPNIIIGSAAGLSFTDFLINAGPPAVIAFAATTAYLLMRHRGMLAVARTRMGRLEGLDPRGDLGCPREVAAVLVCLGLTILGFFLHGPLGLEPATIALSGAALYLIVGRLDVEDALEAIEWGTLFFFVGLFVMVGALEVNGTLTRVAGAIEDATGGSEVAQVLGVAWVSAIASGLIDNIPFTTAMVPVVDELSEPGSSVLWWALSIGACYGGNLTLIGASANLVAAGSLGRSGYRVTFLRFLRIGVPVTILSMAVGTGWLLLLVAVT